MTSEHIYDELKNAITEFVSQHTDETVKEDLRVAVQKYFEDEISRYSADELIKYLDTPEKVISHFKDYLDGKDCLLC